MGDGLKHSPWGAKHLSQARQVVALAAAPATREHSGFSSRRHVATSPDSNWSSDFTVTQGPITTSGKMVRKLKHISWSVPSPYVKLCARLRVSHVHSV